MRLQTILFLLAFGLLMAPAVFAGDAPGEAGPGAEGDVADASPAPAPDADPAGEDPGESSPPNGNGKAPEGVDFSLGLGGGAQLQFADGTSVQGKENSRGKVSREKKGDVPWSYLSFDEGVFQVEGQSGPVEYILPGINVLAVGASYQAMVRRGDRIEVELVNQGPGAVVAKDVLTDMEIRLEAGTGILALVDLSGGATQFKALAGNAGDVISDVGGERSAVGPGQEFAGRAGAGAGTLREEEEAKIVAQPPTEMVDYRFAFDTGAGGRAEFVFRDGGRAFVQEGASVAVSVVKRKEGSGSKSLVNLKAGEVRFDLGTGDFLLETEVVAVMARAAVFFAEATATYDRYRNLRGEMIQVRSKKEGPSQGMVAEVKAGSELLVKHGPEVEGVIFEIPEEVDEETVFRIRGKTLRMPGGGRLTFGSTGTTVTVSVPTPESEFVATVPLEAFLAAPADAALQDSGDLIETGNVSP